MLFEQAGNFILDKLESELRPDLYYHNAAHTRDVYSAAERIGKGEHICDYDMTLLLTAACYHDSGFLRVAKGHETESCAIAKQALPDFGFSAEDIEKICGMIMATRIPQSPKNHLEEILADADLDYLGRDDFFTIGDKMYKELGLGHRDEWNEMQLKFLERHRYFTQTALDLRDAKKKKHLEQIRKQLP